MQESRACKKEKKKDSELYFKCLQEKECLQIQTFHVELVYAWQSVWVGTMLQPLSSDISIKGHGEMPQPTLDQSLFLTKMVKAWTFTQQGQKTE